MQLLGLDGLEAPGRYRKSSIGRRRAYVWKHESRHGYWQYSAWFPQPVHTVRVECITKRKESQFKRLCAEAIRTLRFR
jgi:hypothetical protein